MVLSDDKGLVADPVNLINLQVTANIDGDGSKVAKNEASLARMSSNGLSYIILVVILIGFINRIRRKERVAVPFVVDELKDLSVGNATALLNLLARNNITMVSAFPDVNPDLAPLFTKNYKILPGRTLATVKLEHEEHGMLDQVSASYLKASSSVRRRRPRCSARWQTKPSASEVDAFLGKIKRRLTITPNGQAYYASWVKVARNSVRRPSA